MCLRTIDKKEETDKIKKSIPPKGLKVYKVVEVGNYYNCRGKYYPLFQWTHIPFEEGIDEAKTNYMINIKNSCYKSGFHFWMTKDAAEWARNAMPTRRTIIIECIVKKEWIICTGQNDVVDGVTRETIVASKAIFPKYKE